MASQDNDHLMKEYAELMLVKVNYKKKVNFHIYESFFRTFCKNKHVEAAHALYADSKSWTDGITYWYGGK